MNEFKVTEDRRVYLDDVEVKRVHGFSVNVEAGKDPEVVLRVGVGSIRIEGYTDFFSYLRTSTEAGRPIDIIQEAARKAIDGIAREATTEL